jgi:YHS domain-containing protein
MKIISALFLVLATSTTLLAQEKPTKTHHNHQHDAKASKSTAALAVDGTDPICGMKVSKGSKLVSEHKGKQIGFCSPVCKEKFDKNPEKYVKQ